MQARIVIGCGGHAGKADAGKEGRDHVHHKGAAYRAIWTDLGAV